MSTEHWEAYYRTGALAACPISPDGGLGTDTRDAWTQFFSSLREDARILDIGCGNGLIPALARETAVTRDRHWVVEGVDLATTDPRTCLSDGREKLAGVRFHPGTDAGHLPFADETFDAVSGHFALEYMDVPRVLREVHRVMRAGADCQFVLHHAESVLVRSARVSTREAKLVFDETRIYRKLKRLVAMQAVIPGATEGAASDVRDAIRTLKEAFGFAREAGGGRVIGVALDAARKLLSARNRMPAQAAALEVDRAERELRVSVRGLRDLAERGLTGSAMDEIQGQAHAIGFSLVEALPLHEAGTTLVGWQLMMHRE